MTAAEHLQKILRMFNLARNAKRRRVAKKWWRAALRESMSGWATRYAPRDVAIAQLTHPVLCMPFHDFHRAVETAVGRPVWTHEFADPDRLRAMIH